VLREETVRLRGISLDLIMPGRPSRAGGIATLTLLRDESSGASQKIISDCRAYDSRAVVKVPAVSRFLTFHYRDEVLLIPKAATLKSAKELSRLMDGYTHRALLLGSSAIQLLNGTIGKRVKSVRVFALCSRDEIIRDKGLFSPLKKIISHGRALLIIASCLITFNGSFIYVIPF